VTQQGPPKPAININDVATKLAGFHIQFRVHANFFAQLINKKSEPDLLFRIDGVDFSLMKPSGPLRTVVSVMIKLIALQ
jgi:hypothetical protein